MITAKLITDAWAHCRRTNNSIPDEVLDFMKDVSLAALESQNSVKLPVSGWQEFGKQKPKVGDEVVVMDKRNGRKQVWNIKDEDFDEEWLKSYCWHLPPA